MLQPLNYLVYAFTGRWRRLFTPPDYSPPGRLAPEEVGWGCWTGVTVTMRTVQPVGTLAVPPSPPAVPRWAAEFGLTLAGAGVLVAGVDSRAGAVVAGASADALADALADAVGDALAAAVADELAGALTEALVGGLASALAEGDACAAQDVSCPPCPAVSPLPMLASAAGGSA